MIKDYAEAIKWYRKSADQGNAEGLRSIGNLYAEGEGVEKDFEIKSLSVILGHSSVKITLDKYVHVTMQMKRNNMSKVKLAV